MREGRSRITRWIDERTGLVSGLERLCARRSTTPPGWSRLMGVVLMTLLGVEALSGVLLAFVYSPSATDAWASIVYVEQTMAMGAALRGVHHWGMSALMAVTLLHLLVTMVAGLYRRPREVNWWLGLALLHLLVGFSMTGLPLVYDQQNYWASQVETQIMASVPLVGPLLREVILGGNDYGNLTLTRLYALHVFVLPGALIGLLAAHVKLAKRHRAQAPTAPAQPLRAPLVAAPRALAAALLTVAGLVGWSWVMGGAPLTAPADPTQAFDARPEWYFMPLYVLRGLLPDDLELLATVVLPGVGVGALALLPLLDRGGPRLSRTRLLLVGPLVGGLVAFVALGFWGKLQERASEAHQAAMTQAAKDTQEALELAAMGGVPLDPADLIENDPARWGAQLFAAECAACHSVGDGAGTAPDLAGWGSRAWLAAFLANPDHPNFYGDVEALRGEMEPVSDYGLDATQVAAVVDGLLRNRGDHAPAGLPAEAGARFAEAFEAGDCDGCHRLEVDGALVGGGALGPDLGAYGSPAWVDALLIDPGAKGHYGRRNAMPSFADRLDRDARRALRAYLFTLAALPVAPTPAGAPPEARDAAGSAGSDGAGEPSADGEGGAGDGAGGSDGAGGAGPDGAPVEGAAPGALTLADLTGDAEYGAEVFEENCQACHEVAGVGGASEDHGPTLTAWGSRVWHAAFLAEPDHVAFYGATELEGMMKPLADYGVEEAEEIDLILDALQRARADRTAGDDEGAARDARWAEVFDDYSCSGCHGLVIGGEQVGRADGVGPDLTRYGSVGWVAGLLAAPDSPAHYGDDNTMPAFTSLDPEERDSVIRYLMTLSEQAAPEALREQAAPLLER